MLGFDVKLKSFTLLLQDNEILQADEIVRIVPGKRLVVLGTWKGRAVVAKLFFEARHLKRELAGLKLLKENKIPSPTLWYQGKSMPHTRALRGADKHVYVMIMRRIMHAQSLKDIWQLKDIALNSAGEYENKTVEATPSAQPPDGPAARPALTIIQSVLVELATQHVLGIRQLDLHLDNFLMTQRTIYTLDGAGIETFPHILPKRESMENVALFIAQLGALEKNLQKELFCYYAKTRGWVLKPADVPEFLLMVKKWQEKRWQQYHQKIMRESSHFAVIKKNWWRTLIGLSTMSGAYDRRYASAELVKHLQQPELFFQHQSAQMLKAGRSSTVIKVNFDQYVFVVKRYNIKNVWHGLRRALRRTRANSAWRLAQKLNLFHVATAQPVAFIEKKFLGFKSTSYYITEYVNGLSGSEYFFRNCNDRQLSCMVNRMMQLLKQLFKLEITHGDLKITNILIDEHERPILIDFDGAQEHASMSSLHKAWRKELKRFLLNFDDTPAIKDKFLAEMKIVT